MVPLQFTRRWFSGRGAYLLNESFRVERTVSSPTQYQITRLSASNQAALSHFDQYYSRCYGPVAWSTMRAALLCPSTKVTVLNRGYPNFEDSIKGSKSQGLVDLISTLLEHQGEYQDDELTASKPSVCEQNACTEFRGIHPNQKQFIGRSDIPIPETEDLTEFVPVTELVSESEVFTRSHDSDVAFVPKSLSAEGYFRDIVEENLVLPDALHVMCPRRGNVSEYRKPMCIDGQFEFYPMDLGSVLAVLALNLTPEDTVLDLCAAPGGKAVTMLQTLMPRRLVCVDNSVTRLDRLKRVLDAHVPIGGENVPSVHIIQESDLFDFIRLNLAPEDRLFDKVIVDAPCSTDRHALTSDEGNLFSKGKSKARASLVETQLALLRRGLNLCRPGGSVIYSTCTLSPAQNHAVIEACLDAVSNSQATSRFAPIDLTPLIRLFKSALPDLGLHILPVTFDQPVDRPIGLLVVPVLSGNYGPTFICKLKRLV